MSNLVLPLPVRVRVRVRVRIRVRVRARASVVNTSSHRRREGVQAHQYTQDTGTQRSTMRKQREVEGRTRGGKPQVFFSFPCLFIG